jgi:hypothetical protein
MNELGARHARGTANRDDGHPSGIGHAHENVPNLQAGRVADLGVQKPPIGECGRSPRVVDGASGGTPHAW